MKRYIQSKIKGNYKSNYKSDYKSDMDYYEEKLRNKEYFIWMTLGAFIVALVFSLVIICFQAGAEEINLRKIIYIESSGNNLAWNRIDDSRGLFQITPICLKEYNRLNTRHYSPDDLWNPEINTKIAHWYLTKRIPQMLRRFGKPATVENILIAYNAGISYVAHNKPLPKITKLYLKKYRGEL